MPAGSSIGRADRRRHPRPLRRLPRSRYGQLRTASCSPPGTSGCPAVYGVDLIAKTATLRPWQPLTPRPRLHDSPDAPSCARCRAARPRTPLRSSGPATGLPGVPPPAPPRVRRRAADLRSPLRRRGLPPRRPGPRAGCLAHPAAGLSLCAPEAWDALVGVPSRQEARLLLVDPGDSARSYLLRKLIPATPGGGPLPRRSATAIRPGAPLDDAELAAIAAWIDGGALR